MKLSKILEQNASEVDRKAGLDIADFLIRTQKTKITETHNNSQEVTECNNFSQKVTESNNPPLHPDNWLIKGIEAMQKQGKAGGAVIQEYKSIAKKTSSQRCDDVNLGFSHYSEPAKLQPITPQEYSHLKNINLSPCEVVTDIETFFTTHRAIIEQNTSKGFILPYIERYNKAATTIKSIL